MGGARFIFSHPWVDKSKKKQVNGKMRLLIYRVQTLQGLRQGLSPPCALCVCYGCWQLAYYVKARSLTGCFEELVNTYVFTTCVLCCRSRR